MKLKATKTRDGLWRVVARAFLYQDPTTLKQTIVTKVLKAEDKATAELQAEEWVTKQKKQFQRTHERPAPNVETLAVYGRRWLEGRRPHGPDDGMKRSTWQGYSEIFRQWIEEPTGTTPRLGRVLMRDLAPDHVRALYQYMGQTPNQKGQTTWGRSRQLHLVLRQIFQHAYANGAHYLTREGTAINVAEALKRSFPRRHKQRPAAYTPEQLTAFLRAVGDDRYRAFWFLFAVTGARPRELLALTWPDLDLEAGTMSVNKRIRVVPQRFREGGEKWEIDTPKTDTSIHEVELPELLLPILAAHRDRQAKEQKARRKVTRAISPWGDLVFATQTGQPVDWNNLKTHYVRICRRARLGTFGIAPKKRRVGTVCRQHGKDCVGHGPAKDAPFKPLLSAYHLRHTAATTELADGVPIEVVSERRGHANTSFTQDTYIGKKTKRQHLATEAWNRRLQQLEDTGTGGKR